MTQAPSWLVNIDDDDNPDVREGWMWGGKRAFIFVIDATEEMFERNIDDTSYFLLCLKACKEIMLQSILRQEKDLFGIVLYGTKHVGQASLPNHLTTVQELSLCGADQVKELINILQDVDEFEKKHGHSNNFSLADALWHCSKMISNCSTKFYQKTILLMTCNDNPHSADVKLQHDTRTRAKDLSLLDTQLEILPFGMTFNFDNFFKEVYQITHQEDDPDISDQGDSKIKIISEVNDILSFVGRTPNKRSASRILWSLGGDVKLGIAVYSFTASSPPFPKRVRVERSKNELVTSRVQTFSADTGEEVGAAETSKTLRIGGQTLTFQKEELQKAQRLFVKGLTLLGFKPIHTFKPWYHKKQPYFVYPEERLVKGSRTLFAALHERCLSRKVAAICYFTPRQASRPSLVGLVAQAEKLSKDNVQLLPPGFLLQILPYADNIRDLKEQQVNCSQPEPELVSLAENIINKTKFKYDPSHIENPKLQKHWAGIEALALGYEEPRETPDLALPDLETIDGRIDDLASAFMEMAFPDGFDEACVKSAAKRAMKRATTPKPPVPKKMKPNLEDMSMEDIANQGHVEKLKVENLKQYLISEGLKVSKMKKADLVEAVYNHLGISQP